MIIIGKVYRRLRFYLTINWIKTIWFNFKKLPFNEAKKFPILFYGKVKFQNIKGKIIIKAPLKFGMIGFGQRYEKNTVHKGIAEISLKGTMVFKGQVQFGKDYFICVEKDAYAEFGHMSSLGTGGKIICVERIVLGKFARLGSESQIIDTSFHQMIDTLTGEKFPMTAPITINDYNYIGNRVSIMKGTITPDYCTVASNSLCTKNYTSLGQNILIGGIPAKLLEKNITRDWKTEEKLFDEWMKI